MRAHAMAVGLLLLSVQAFGGEPESHRAFAARHGGLVVDGATAERAGAVARLVFATPGLAHLRLQVVADREIGAWAWPSGELFVSRGLVDAADDEELIAAIAHEVGHLLGGGAADGAQGLAGTLAAPALARNAETRADGLGCRLLHARALPTAGMRRVLLRLVASARDAAEARAYGERLRDLDPACASTP